MAATFIEPENLDKEENLEENEELTEFDVEDSTEEQTTDVQPEQEEDQRSEEDDIPEKYRGKSTAEIIQMHREAEKLLGKHSSEVGELRRIVDDFVKSNLEKDAHKQDDSDDDIDFFDDPKRAVEQAIKNNPELAEVKNLTKQMRQQEFMNKLNTNFPEHTELVNNQEFIDWLGESPIRQQLYQRAANEFDWDSAEELLSTWRKISNYSEKAKQTQKADLKQQRKAASTGSSKGSGEQKSRKIYRRADIINLMQKDPARYEQLSDEIMKAYQEGRVK